MRSRTVWACAAALTLTATLLAYALFAVSYMDDGLSADTLLALMSSVILSVGIILLLSSRRRFFSIIERDEYVDCFRLKKAGLDLSNRDEIRPKGKMPK